MIFSYLTPWLPILASKFHQTNYKTFQKNCVKKFEISIKNMGFYEKFKNEK